MIIDDGDEITPVCFDFVKHLAPQLKDVFIAYDPDGASRSGYLSADKTAVWKFEELFGGKSMQLDSIARAVIHPLKSLSKRAAMIDAVCEKINELNLTDAVIVTPVIDDILKFTLREKIHNANLVFLSGSEKLVQDKYVKAALTILKFPNIDEFEMRSVLSFLGIPLKYCREVLENFGAPKTFPLDEYTQKYNKLCGFLKRGRKEKLSEQVYEIYTEFFAAQKDLKKFNFFIKQLQEFESVFGATANDAEILNQIENSIISENPAFEEIEEGLIVGTPQKIIDNQIRAKHCFWLDVTSSEWIKNDTGPLYNAWVFQRGWEKDEFTIEDNIALSRDKTQRVLRKLTSCADEIYPYASLFDGTGVENFGGVEDYIKTTETQTAAAPAAPFIPRADQKPVLGYKNGAMGICAVPGAGKTTVLLLLILKLLDDGVKPENIFVLTYMESAARNFRDRIKTLRPDSSQLPNISTIHGLALRILKENENFARLGLNSDFEICDDTQKGRIIDTIADNMKLQTRKEKEPFKAGISVFKLSKGRVAADGPLAKFFKFYQEYERILHEENLIDYDDMLLAAVRLLEENPDILAHYQQVCEYIIEDEAQDSSVVQQRLLGLLSGKHKNLVRCGDVNQAIMTTFSSADVEGFRQFLKTANTVEMDCSQRCCEGVWTLANNLVRWKKDAFYEIFMKPTGKNPESKNAVQAKIFETGAQERNYVLQSIRKIFTANPLATVGVLVRSNTDVNSWANFINGSGLKAILRSDCLEQQGVFRAIFAVMQMVQKPFDNNVVAGAYETLSQLGFYPPRFALKIRECPVAFFEMNCDDINNLHLERFYWDLTYWLSLNLPPQELAAKIGLYYFTSEIEKSNVYLVSTLIKRLQGNYDQVMARLGELAKLSRISGMNFFTQDANTSLAGNVQIMTMHKSKGDEFDYVFLPQLHERNMSLDLSGINLKANDISEDIRCTNPDYKPKTQDELKRELLDESLRLLYVAITRAKKQLHLSASQDSTYYNKPVKPSIIFEGLLT